MFLFCLSFQEYKTDLEDLEETIQDLRKKGKQKDNKLTTNDTR